MKRAILVVDDEIDMLMLLKRSLAADLNCRVETAPSGEAALQLLGRIHFDLVLADIRMPGMNGLELLELIKRDNPDQTVVMMTAFGRIETAVQAMKIGAFDFVTKPFDHETLIVRLEKALEHFAELRTRFPNSAFREAGDYRHALTQLLLARYPEARRELSAYLKTFSSGAFTEDATYRLGVAQYGDGATEEAIQTFISFVEKFPDSAVKSGALTWPSLVMSAARQVPCALALVEMKSAARSAPVTDLDMNGSSPGEGPPVPQSWHNRSVSGGRREL